MWWLRIPVRRGAVDRRAGHAGELRELAAERLISAVRDLTLGLPAAADLVQSIAWLVGLLVVFVPLSVRLYRRSA